jgi:hypothetical protein
LAPGEAVIVDWYKIRAENGPKAGFQHCSLKIFILEKNML